MLNTLNTILQQIDYLIKLTMSKHFLFFNAYILSPGMSVLYFLVCYR